MDHPTLKEYGVQPSQRPSVRPWLSLGGGASAAVLVTVEYLRELRKVIDDYLISKEIDEPVPTGEPVCIPPFVVESDTAW